MTVRQRTWLLTALLGVLGAAAVAVGGVALGSTFAALGRHAPLVAYQGIDATGCIAGLGLLTIGAVTLLPAPPTTTGRRGRRDERPPLALPLMMVAAILLVLSPLAGSIGRLIVNGVATSRGYALCPLPRDLRHQPDRWSRADARQLCPA